jgi:uncharacterized membrane protein (UPF0127 family)
MPAPKDGSIYTLKVGRSRTTFSVETVVSPEAITKGLSGRRHFPPKHGMLFLFPDLAPRSMWMPEMRFPIDVVWLDENLTVTYVHRDCPPCVRRSDCPTYSSYGKVKYAIEVLAGQADVIGLVPGVSLSVV